tara:strand:+ start:11844 stop:12092 length:249 start_codon:yes stop_codon:yes gene_type:complete
MAKVWDAKKLCYVLTHNVPVKKTIKAKVAEETLEAKNDNLANPTEDWTKKRIIDWCKDNNINSINSGDTKSDLLDKIAEASE